MKYIRKILIDLCVLKFKIGDKVAPNYLLFKPSYRFPNSKNKEYYKIRKIKNNFIHLEGVSIPYNRKELTLFVGKE